MSVTEVVGAIGSWSLNLSANTPRRIIDQIDYWGHIAVLGGKTNIDLVGDNVLDSARYVGVLRKRTLDAESPAIGGGGLAVWLGDEDEKGYVLETKVTFTAADFNTVINTILPPSVTAGTINTQPGTYTNTHQYKDPRTVLSYVTENYNAEWRMRGKAKVDVGTVDQLYGATPTAAIVRRLPQGGSDVDVRALPGNSSLDADVEDFTTKIILLAEGDNTTVTQATADIAPAKNPYLDINGNPLVMKRMVSENDTSLSTAPTRAALQLGRFDSPREAIRLTTATHDLRGDVVPGGYIWVEDDDARLVDEANQINFKGMQLRPLKLRCTELSWPIEFGMGVYYRHWSGAWLDLTPYVEWESGDTTVTVGDYDRPLTGGSGFTQPVTSAPSTNDTIAPNTPLFTTPFDTTLVTSAITGLSVSEMNVKWGLPLNSDGSVILDGNYYEIRWRTNSGSLQQPTNTEMSVYTNDQLKTMGTNQAPIQTDLGTWQYIQVPWGALGTRVPGLQPGIPYDWQIRAIDTSVPKNISAWSSTYTQVARRDTQAPPTPGQFDVYASPVSVLVNYGFTVAGTAGFFTQVSDIAGIEVHLGVEPTFEVYPDSPQFSGTMLGRLPATYGMQLAGAAVVGTFAIPSEFAGKQIYIKIVAFDLNNNRSPGSEAVISSAELIQNAYISDLVVSKVTGGTITSDWLIGANIWTAQSGQRVTMGFYGIEAYNQAGTITFDLNSSDGSFFAIGTLQSGINGRRIVISGATNDMVFYPEVGETRSARFFSYIPTNYPNDIAVELRAIDSDTILNTARFALLPDWGFWSVAPRGSGGDLISRSNIQVGDSGLAADGWVSISVADITGSAPYTGANRVTRVVSQWGTAEGEWFTGINNSSGTNRGSISLADEQIISELRDGATRTGGYCILSRSGSGLDTYVGHYEPSLGENFLRLMSSSVDLEMFRLGVRKMKVGSVRTCVEALGSLGYADERAVLNTADGTRVMIYWQSGGVMSFGNASSGAFIKNFVIEHPTDPKRFLVHACTEGPEARVEYEGIAVVQEGFGEVTLPAYFEAATIAEGRTVQLTVIAEPQANDRLAWLKKPRPVVVWEGGPGSNAPGENSPMGLIPRVMASVPARGKFQIYSDLEVMAFRVMWRVSAVRSDVKQFKVEPKKTEVMRLGSGPYTWTQEIA